ncbi:MAG: bifunctional [glutamate--ammonia ligase]-adenylyl-L-tyrosine phosphorylase/[glutamate--ammonia-ligase] adenylyltransferase [Desulfobacterales bacterium]
MKHIPSHLIEHLSEKKADLFRSLNFRNLVLPDDERVLKSLDLVFCLSDFVSNNCILAPDILFDLIFGRDLFTVYEPGRYHRELSERLNGCEDEKRLRQQLLQFRQREMIRIAWRDLAGWADLPETLADLTAFADACVDAALDRLHRWHARQPGGGFGFDEDTPGLVVIGMGKLGGTELNFSSDIDLVFAYPDAPAFVSRQKSNQLSSFYSSLARRLIQVLGSSASDIGPFRVDMRLRPFGDSGPLVMRFDAMEDYYQQHGREWERYAWLRARVIAGNKTAGDDLLLRLEPFIYRRYLDYTVLDVLRDMKKKISVEVKRKDMADNLKLGSGGIREIEFFCQVFQILRGGVVPSLRRRRTDEQLNALFDEGIISRESWEDLIHAYFFLRRTENHLQEISDLQTHLIPKDALGRMRIAFSMGFETHEAFDAELTRLRKIVHRHFSQLLGADDDGAVQRGSEEIWQNPKDIGAEDIIRSIGYTDPSGIVSALAYLKEAPETRALSPNGRRRVDRLVPNLLEAAAGCDESEAVLFRLLDLIRSIQRRTSYIALLLENPGVLSHLVRLAEKSPWIIRFLSRHPVILDEFLHPGSLYSPPEKSGLESELNHQMKRSPAGDLEYRIENLCIFKQTNLLRVAAADIAGMLTVKRVSDHLTDIAETVLEQVLDLAWTYMHLRHGTPLCDLEGHACESGFLIVGYGKLGGIEMGYDSDLDLVFLHAGKRGSTFGTDRPIENAYYYSRLGQRIVHLLTADTRAGKLYDTDMRLRPSGNAGPLVSHIESFSAYQRTQAWTWEQQALVRARPICGDPTLAERCKTIRFDVLSTKRNEIPLKQDIRAMRDKIRKARASTDSGMFDLKEDTGGIIDIEFLVQYLVLLKSHRHPELLKWTDNVRILNTLQQNRIIDDNSAEALHDAYLTFRTAIHRLTLQEKPPKAPIGRFASLRHRVIDVWHRIIGGSS